MRNISGLFSGLFAIERGGALTCNHVESALISSDFPAICGVLGFRVRFGRGAFNQREGERERERERQNRDREREREGERERERERERARESRRERER